jgi:uncharacterized membrane protein (UPF0127 family)
MQLINQTKGVILAAKVNFADNTFRRMKGLLGRVNLAPAEALVLTKTNSIHSFFMRFVIDVLFLDKKGEVIGLIQSFKPWRLTSIYWNADSVVELPAGTILSTRTEPKDLIISR